MTGKRYFDTCVTCGHVMYVPCNVVYSTCHDCVAKAKAKKAMEITHTDEQWFNEGARAWEENKRREDCPYLAESDAWFDWHYGYHARETHALDCLEENRAEYQ